MKKFIDEKVVLDILKCFVLPTLILSFVFNYKTYTLLHHYEKKKKTCNENFNNYCYNKVFKL